MTNYTREELDRLNSMRRQRMGDSERERDQWDAAPVGWSESETVYVIEYQHPGDPTWYAASPFYTPLRLNSDETHSKEEAHEVAVMIRKGERAVSKGQEGRPSLVAAVRVIERVSSAKIISQLS